MRKIAFSGMRGRRGDAVYLIGVIVLSLLFMTVATQLLSSIKETDRQQNFNVFGQWKAALLCATEDETQALRAGGEELGVEIAQSGIIGASDEVGVIGVMSDKMEEAGRFKLYEGRMPEADNEIAIEMSRIGEIGDDIRVGGEIDVFYTTDLPTGDERTYDDYLLDAAWPQMEAERGPITDEDIDNYREILKGYDSGYLDILEQMGRDEIAKALKRFLISNNDGYGEKSSYKYNRRDPIIYEDVNLNVQTSYLYSFNTSDFNKTDTETIMRDGFINERTMTVKRTYKISGIIQSYSDRWDAGNYKLPNAYISEAGKDRLDAAYASMLDRLKYGFDMPNESNLFLLTDTMGMEELYEAVAARIWPGDNMDWAMLADSGAQHSDFRLRMNPLAYPAGMGETEDALAKGVLFGIFLITVCAVFQMLFTQLKRRAKRVALLKAVGACNAQVARMLLWECGFVLIISLPLGVLLGGLLAYGAVWAINVFGGGSLNFAADIDAVLLGMALCCASVLLGMAGPLIAALRVTPVQGIQETGKRKQRAVKPKPGERLTFAAVCRRRRAAERNKSALSLGLSTFTAVILLTALTLSFLSFTQYTDREEYENAPDYLLQLNYGVAGREIDEKIEELKQITGVGRIDALKKAQRLYISFDGMQESPILNAFKEILPQSALYEHFGGKRAQRSFFDQGSLIDEPETAGTYIADMYGVDVGSGIYDRLIQAVTAGNVSKERFKAGKEVILLVPLYMEGGNYQNPPKDVEAPGKYKKEERMRALLNEHNVLSITTDKRKSGYYKSEHAINPGDPLHITVCRENLADETLHTNFYEYEVQVGGVIHYFPDEAIWPFSQYREGYMLIGSYEMVNTVYPMAAGGRYDMWEMQSMGYAQELYYPTLYGQTMYAIYGNEQANREETDLGLLSLSKKYGYSFYNYKDMNREVYAAALNTTMIVCLLGLAAALIAGVILYNTEQSAVEQDRKRIGVLQALGVTEHELKRWKWKAGLINGLISLLIANAFVFCVVLLTSVVETGGMDLTIVQRMMDIFKYRLALYPWAAHIGLCAAYLLCTVLIHRIPIRLATKHTPIENVRS